MINRLLLTLLLTFSFGLQAKDIKRSSSRSIASMKHSIRVTHSKELLGKYYKRSVVRHMETNDEMEKYIFEFIKKSVPNKYKKKARQIARAVIDESFRHTLDPYFVMAIISGESSFNPEAKGPVGEVGMMQLRPTTAEWIAGIYKLKYRGKKSLKNPIANIKLGTAYLAWLREKFEGHGQLYVAAYNMGPGNVKKALRKNRWPKDYSRHVMKRYVEFYKKVGTDYQTSLKQNIELLSSMQRDDDLMSFN
jgi:soluble lytic murein transglycosylase